MFNEPEKGNVNTTYIRGLQQWTVHFSKKILQNSSIDSWKFQRWKFSQNKGESHNLHFFVRLSILRYTLRNYNFTEKSMNFTTNFLTQIRFVLFHSWFGTKLYPITPYYKWKPFPTCTSHSIVFQKSFPHRHSLF